MAWHESGTRSYELLRVEHPEEMRVVTWEGLPGGRISLRERTDGQYTLLVFDALTREQVVTLDSDGARMLEESFGLLPMQDLGEQLAAFFAGGRFLSDLQDHLEAHEIAYAYSTTCGPQATLRPPQA